MALLSPTLSASGGEGPEGESRIYVFAETGLLVKILPHKNECEVLWNTDTSLVDLLHTIHTEEWHTEAIDIAQFNVTRIGHQDAHTEPIYYPPRGQIFRHITTLRDLWSVIIHPDGGLNSLPRPDSVEFGEDVAGTSIYWASESIPDVQDSYPNCIRIKLPLPLDDQAINLLHWYYSNLAPSAIRQEYETGGDPVRQIVSVISNYIS